MAAEGGALGVADYKIVERWWNGWGRGPTGSGLFKLWEPRPERGFRNETLAAGVSRIHRLDLVFDLDLPTPRERPLVVPAFLIAASGP